MTTEEKYKALKKIFWDYNTSLLPLSKIINKDLSTIDDYDFRLIINRMLERLNWYDILDILGIELIKRLLTPELIDKLRSKELRDRYERLRRILLKEPLPFTGWDPEYRKRIKATVLSYRWNRT